MKTRTIVVIDDEQSVLDVARAYLEREGFSVCTATSGAEGLALAERTKPALIVLDLMLPDVGGEQICTEIRHRSDLPILMLTARASEDDRVQGLCLGADDYLTKPFSPRELVARVQAILRRSSPSDAPLVPSVRLAGGHIALDTVRHEVIVDGKLVDLTPNEYKLLTTLARYPGRVYSRYELVNHVQGYDYDGYERTIDAHVKNLRKKIEPNPHRPRYVLTVLGTGYRLAKQ